MPFVKGYVIFEQELKGKGRGWVATVKTYQNKMATFLNFNNYAASLL